MTYDLCPISPPVPSIPWQDRFPPEERGDPLPAAADLIELMARVLAQSTANLTDDAACLIELMNNRFTAREASGHLRDVQRQAIGYRVRGEVV